MQQINNKFKVGDIVICHSGTRSDGKRGFVEEIVRDSYRNWQASYSIYGLEPVKFDKYQDSHPSDYYFGDHVEDELGVTGESMTLGQLQEFRQKLVIPQGDGFAKDIDIVIKNLGKASGRNEK